MRIGEYEASDGGNSAGTAVTFLLIGLGAGALIGLLLAPKPGKQLRKDLRRKYDSARETVEDWTDDAKDFARRDRQRHAVDGDERSLSRRELDAQPLDGQQRAGGHAGAACAAPWRNALNSSPDGRHMVISALD